MYLASQMHGRTVVTLTGKGLGQSAPRSTSRPAPQPPMVVLEDVDLVAMARSVEPTNAIVFEPLNGMDEDHDILFVVTTTAPISSKPALAAAGAFDRGRPPTRPPGSPPSPAR
jgi:hypothetical protein